MESNRFGRFKSRAEVLPPPTASSLFALSLGALGSPDLGWGELALPYGSWDRIIAARVLYRRHDAVDRGVHDAWSRKETAIHELCRRGWLGRDLAVGERRFLLKELKSTSPWAARLVLSLTLAESARRSGKNRQAAMSLALAAGAHRSLSKLLASEAREDTSGLLGEYETLCRSTLASFEPPIPPGSSPVAAVARVSKKLRRRRKPAQPSRVMNALDAVITAGHSAPGIDIERRVVHDIAKMLGGWVLLHYRHGNYLTRRPQAEHTLSVWTVHRLAREDQLRARKIKERA